MRVSYSMFVGQYNPPANEGYDKLRGQVFVVARKPHEPNTHPYEPNELLVQPIGADSMRRALKEPRISYTGLKERHFRVLAELTKGTNANQVDLNAYKEQLDIEASYDAPVDTTEDQLKEAEYDVLYEYDERGEVDLPELISRVRSGELREEVYYSDTSRNEIEFKDNKIRFTNANLDDRFNVPVFKVITGDTVLPALIMIELDSNLAMWYENRSIKSLVNGLNTSTSKYVFKAPVNGNLVEIWRMK